MSCTLLTLPTLTAPARYGKPRASGWLDGMAEELDDLTSKELHDRAVDKAVHHLDVAFLWRLAKAIPAAEAAVGHPDQAEADVSHLSAILNELAHSGDGAVADALRPLYLDYLRG
jgi:hypothetical protein